MSYTAPQYVDTKEQAILALASVIADEDKGALGDGSVNKALDVLADVLAQQDVSVPQTNAGAILALAQYVTGGGGASLTGNLAMLAGVDGEPSGYPFLTGGIMCTVLIGGHEVANGPINAVIAGADVALGSAPSGAWLVVPTSATYDQDTGPSVEFTKTALTVTGSTVHIPENIPEPITLEYEEDGKTVSDELCPAVCIGVAGGGSNPPKPA